MFLYFLFSCSFFLHSVVCSLIIAADNGQVNYSTITEDGTLRLVLDESPIIGYDNFAIPNLADVVQNCKLYPPSESGKFFGCDLSILHINARSIHQSHHEVVTLVTTNSHAAHFVLLSETWLHPDLISGYAFPGYELLHSIPEHNVLGKGCAIYIRDDIFPHCSKLDHLCANENEFQSIIVQVTCPGTAGFIIGATYRSPSYPLTSFLPYLEATLNDLNRRHQPCFWGGDWNVNLFEYNSKNDVKSFLDCQNAFGFFPTISIPTRVTTIAPFTETLIDNIFTNSLSTILHSGTICCGIADHLAVFCTTNLLQSGQRNTGPPGVKKFNFSKLDEFKVNISNRLAEFNRIDCPEQACDVFVSTLTDEIEHFSSFPSRRNTPIQPWITPAILRSMDTRSKLLKNFLRDRSAENELKYKKYRNTLRLTIRHSKKHYFHKQFAKNKHNPKLLWKDLLEAVQKPKVKPRPASKFEVNGAFITDQLPIAESFNDFFSKVAPNLDSALGPCDTDPLAHMDDLAVPGSLTFSPVTEEQVLPIVLSLKDAGAGFDGLNAKLLKKIIPAVISQLTHLLNLCISNHTFPSPLKMAVITPVFKSGSRTQFSNYRPISVLPVISKVLEIIMFNQLVAFIKDHNILYDFQFGFRSNHSTYMPISILHDLITDNLISNKITVGIYLDLARAFDTVNIDILLSKLNIYGISGNALSFLTSYLTDRTHRVKFDNTISSPKKVTCGVPQGSVLGPVLFLLYINDLQKACPIAKFLLFADDTAIFYSASSKDELESIINQSFPKIVVWLHANRLSLSIHKTTYQVYSGNNADKNICIPVSNGTILHADTVKYLGVLIDENLKFKSHISKVSGVISRQIGIIGRARYLLNAQLLMLLYNSMILPYLTYCVSIWGSNYPTTIQPIIVAQKRAARMIAGAPAMAHTSPIFRELRILKFSDLVKYQLLNVLHDFLHDRLPEPIAAKFTLSNPVRFTRISQHFSEQARSSSGHAIPNYKLHNYREFTLFARAPKVWNAVIASRIPDIQDVPFSKSFFKKVVKIIFLDQY